MSDVLGDALIALADTLDTHERAWVLGVGWCGGPPSGEADLREVLRSAGGTGEFPSGPFPVRWDTAQPRGHDDWTIAAARFELSGRRQFESRVGWSADGVIGEALTRSGCLDDGAVQPSHVMLSDVESVLADTIVLVETAARQTSYDGPRRLRIAVACEVPGEPLELRAYDEGGGDTLRPAAGYTEFEPIAVEYANPRGPDDLDRLLWETALAISLQFGVFLPQMVGQARTLAAYPFAPAEAGPTGDPEGRR